MSPSPSPASLTAIAATFGIAAVSIYLLVVGRDVFIPLVLGIFIAYLIIALAHAIARLKIGGWRPPGWMSLSASILLFGLMLAFFAQLVAGNIGEAVAAAPQYQDRLSQLLADINSVLASTFNRREALTMTGLLEQIDLRALAGQFAAAVQSIVGSTFEILIYVIFVLLEYRTFDRKLAAMFPDPARYGHVRATLIQIGRQTETYVLIKTIVSVLVAAATYAALLAFDVDFAAFLALLVFFLNFIPYIGSAVGVALPALLALLQFGSLTTFTLIAGLLVAAHAVIGNVLEPRLMGHSLNLSPLLMVIGLAAWGAVWGITGMILSVPLMVIAMIVFGQFPRTRPLAILMSESGKLT